MNDLFCAGSRLYIAECKLKAAIRFIKCAQVRRYLADGNNPHRQCSHLGIVLFCIENSNGII